MRGVAFRLGVVLLFLLGGAASVLAQNDAVDLYSPTFLALGANPSSQESPQADRLNPAASGTVERPTLDLSYLGLAALGTTTGWGNVVNAGVSIPTRVGVFSGSGRFLGSTLPNLDLGSVGDFNFTFSKKIYPSLSVGAGVGFQIGSVSDWGLGLNIGVMNDVGTVGFLKDVRWGVSLLNVGRGYTPVSGTSEVGTSPPVFTPAAGVSFTLVDSHNVKLSFAPQVSFPSFQDVRAGIGGEFTYGDLLSLRLASVADLKDIQAGTARTIPLSLGMTLHLKTDVKKDVKLLGITKRGYAKSDVNITASAAPLSDGVWAFGLGANVPLGQIDRTPPVISFDTLDPDISPNGDGIQDTLTIPFSIRDSRFIKGYSFIIEDSSGKAVRTMTVQDTGPSSKGVRNFIDRLFSVEKSIPIPDHLTWDGMDDAGKVVPDGTYHYYATAWDDNGNIGKSPVGTVVVDTVAPSATISAPYLEFSPNGDGKKDVLIIDQSGSSEVSWTGTILTPKGVAVAHFHWDNGPPTGFQWNGLDDNGAKLPDGVYTYRLTSTDLAGNTGSAELPGIILNTQTTPVTLSEAFPAFSPNGDGVKDTEPFAFDVPVKKGIDSWSLTIKDSAGNSRRSYSGTTEIPSVVVFDGKDANGAVLPDGTYSATLSVIYTNGNNPVAVSPSFTIDDTPPRAVVTAPYTEFSPNGDGNKDVLPIEQSGSTEELWSGAIEDSSGSVVLHMSWSRSAPQSFQWNGRDDSGKLVPDGSYSYVVTSTDAAGNVGTTRLGGIFVNTRPTPAALSIDLSAFSPNGDGIKDTIHFELDVPVTAGLQKWQLDVKDGAGNVRRTFSGQATIPATIEFDGKDSAGNFLPQGSYTGALSVWYANGNNPTASSPAFALDLTPPTAAVTENYTVFSPNGDGNKDYITFDQTTTKKASWQGIIRNSTGTVVRTVSWRDRPDAQFVWDGHGNDKSLLPDGTYTYTLEGTDAAGNTGRSAPLTFAIDTTATPVVVSTDLTYFSPNGDGIQDTISIMPSLKVATGVVSFDLVVLDARGTPVRTFSGKQQVPAKITWDGRDGFGNRAPDGQYTAQLTVLYENGNKPVAKTNPFFIDTVYPTVQVSASPLLFSPDGDGRLDSVSFTQSSSSEGQWEGTIRDSAGTVVRTYYWKGEAQSFVWDGRDDAGNIVLDGTYSYLVTATDAAGNHTEKRIGDIVVDTRPTPISIGASSDGFSPNGDGFRDTISFSLSVGLKSGIDSWKVDMVDAGGSVQKSFAGGSSVPETIVWDGKRNDGTASPDGSYTAVMSVSYAKGNAPIARSAPFLLAVAPPKISVSIGPLPFSPDGDGVNDTLSIALSAQDPSPIVSWSATIVDPVGHFFRSFSGQGTPPASVVWDGLSADGELVQSAEDYPMTVTMKDALGNVGTVKKSIPIDVLVIREGDKLKVRISSITFAPDTADYLNVPPDRRERNMATLRRLAEIFTKYSQYDIRIEGYAVMVYWDDPVKGKAEQEQVLIPLSKARAEAIKSALVQLGLDAKRITTVGLGGTNPIVPFSDLENRWKDRRVEFVLIRSTARQ